MSTRAFEPGATADVRLRDGLSELAGEPPDFDALIGSWRRAFEAARLALQAARHELPPAELGTRARRLADERVATARLLESFAQERKAKRFLVRLVTSSREAKRLLGLPADAVACVFNVDGVLVPSAAIHAEAWKTTFDEFTARRIERTGVPLASFSVDVDYPRLIHGRSTIASVHEYLASRGIILPDGGRDDPPGSETVNGLANRKKHALFELIARRGAHPFQGARLYLELVRDAAMRCAVVSGSTHMHLVLDMAGLTRLIDEFVDGNTVRSEHLRRKPAPDMLLSACRHLDVSPEQTVVFETTLDGVEAGRAGMFEMVVAVDQHRDAHALAAHGADLVVTDLGELLEQQLAG